MNYQTAILAPQLPHGRYLSFAIDEIPQSVAALTRLAEHYDPGTMVVGLGQPLLERLGHTVAPLVCFPDFSHNKQIIPSTQVDLWIWLKDSDRGTLFHHSRKIRALLAPGFIVTDVVDAFMHKGNKDLSGYEDGTENPTGDEAKAAAFFSSSDPGLNGSSFVAVQKWQHKFKKIYALETSARDNLIGRRSSDNYELDDAPSSAHTRRTAQENFSPEAFILRRSMPWCTELQAGLMFVAFGQSLRAFDVQMRRMSGEEDGIVDGLFQISSPISGSYLWCPPLAGEKLNLSYIGIEL